MLTLSIVRFHLCCLFAAVLACVCLAGCSTPARRARERPKSFHALSSADQKQVLHGLVHAGMDEDDVYIAWGKADLKLESGKENGRETWLYECRLTIMEPFGASDQYGPYHGLGNPPMPLQLEPGFGYRGAGDEGFMRYQPHVRVVEVRYRRAEFADGKLVRAVDRQDGLLSLESHFTPAPVAAPAAPPHHLPPQASGKPRHHNHHHVKRRDEDVPTKTQDGFPSAD